MAKGKKRRKGYAGGTVWYQLLRTDYATDDCSGEPISTNVCGCYPPDAAADLVKAGCVPAGAGLPRSASYVYGPNGGGPYATEQLCDQKCATLRKHRPQTHRAPKRGVRK